MSAFKILLIGSGGSGKTTFFNNVNGGKFEHRYIPTINSHSHIALNNNRRIELIDTAGQEIMAHHEQLACDAVIIMFDVGNVLSYKRALALFKRVSNRSVPIVFVGNKSEQPVHKIKKEKHRLLNTVPYYQISVKNNHNVLAPINHFFN